MTTKRRIIWYGDAAVSSGFARCTHNTIAPGLLEDFDVIVVGIGYDGDPEEAKKYPYPIWPAAKQGQNAFGIDRIVEMAERYKPTAMIVQQDPWNVQDYIERAGNIPVIGAIAVDGLNCRGTELNGLAKAIFWTDFGRDQAKLGGFTGPSAVVPLGVDLNIYTPRDKMTMRKETRIADVFERSGLPADTFLIGAVGRNQDRKRLDLTLRYFAKFVHEHNIPDAVLWLHSAPTGDSAFDLKQLAEFYNISNRVMAPQVSPIHGVSEDTMSKIYSTFDVLLSTSQAEGWCLPAMEAMACEVAVVAPNHSAFSNDGGWPGDTIVKIPCFTTSATTKGINVVGQVPDEQSTVDILHRLYKDRQHLAAVAKCGRHHVEQDRFRWEHISRAFTKEVVGAINPWSIDSYLRENA